jgi:uncharacterized membrane protein
MTDNPVEVFIASFDNEEQAGTALRDFRAMDREGSIELIDAAVIVRNAEGKVRASGRRPTRAARRGPNAAGLAAGIQGYQNIARHAVSAEAAAAIVAEADETPSS